MRRLKKIYGVTLLFVVMFINQTSAFAKDDYYIQELPSNFMRIGNFNVEIRPHCRDVESKGDLMNNYDIPSSWVTISLMEGVKVTEEIQEELDMLIELIIDKEVNAATFIEEIDASRHTYPTRHLRDSYGRSGFTVSFSDEVFSESPFLGSPVWTVFYSGTSNGTSTSSADITLTDIITFRGVGVSVSAAPSGASISGSGTARTVAMSGGRDNTRSVTNRYSNIQVGGMTTSVNKRTEGAFQIGSVTNFLNANDSSSTS